MEFLVVSSDPDIDELLRGSFASAGRPLTVLANLEEARHKVRALEVAVLLCDTDLEAAGSKDIIEFLQYAERSIASSYLILFSDPMPELIARFVNTVQVHACILKPISQVPLENAIAGATRFLEESENTRKANAWREQWTRCLETQVTQKGDAAQRDFEDMLTALVGALDMRENESAYHSRRVALASLYFAVLLEVDPDSYESIFHGGLLHDIGKIGIRDGVLLKPGKLTPEERAHMETHIPIGVKILSGVARLKGALDIPTYHHERYDGNGYASGVAGEDIPLSARIFSLIDVYDALRSERPYKGPMNHEKAISIIHEGRGTQFDPDLADAFCEVPEDTWRVLADLAGGVRSFERAMLTCELSRSKMALSPEDALDALGPEAQASIAES